MSVLTDLTKAVDTTPLFAAVGVTDLAVEKVRDARTRADKVAADVRTELKPATMQARATELVGQAKELPTVVLNQGIAVAGQVNEGYQELAVRGQALVKRIRNQKATKDLVAQAESTIALGKGAVTSAKKAVDDVERSAKATLTTGRREFARVTDVITGSVSEELEEAKTEVEKSVKRTTTAAKRTKTTAENATKKANTSAKAATTSARKTAKSAPKATKKAAAKVGD